MHLFEDCRNNISMQKNGYLWNLSLILNQILLKLSFVCCFKHKLLQKIGTVVTFLLALHIKIRKEFEAIKK